MTPSISASQVEDKPGSLDKSQLFYFFRLDTFPTTTTTSADVAVAVAVAVA